MLIDYGQEIYKTGGRKFAFLNVPPLGCMPMARISSIDGDCIKEPLSYAILHNKALSYVLKELQIKLPGFKYSLYDFYTSLQQRIDHPSNYGTHSFLLAFHDMLQHGLAQDQS